MKHIAILLTDAAAIIGAASCSRAPQPATVGDFYTQRIEAAKTFQDSLIATDGSFIGGVYNLQCGQLPYGNVDKNEILRGMRDVLATDTANQDYIAGIRMGLAVFDVYKELSASESFSKEAFISTIADAFRLDSVNQADLEKLQPLFQQMFTAVKEQAKKRAEAEVYQTKEAVQNRMMGDAVAEKIQSNPDFKPVGNDGLMAHVLTAGNGEVINPNSPIVVSITERHADSRQVIRALAPSAVMAGNPRHQVLSSVIPFMSVGETTEFFVPYSLAYGISGDENIGVGPCESIIAEVTIAPYVAE